MKRALVTAIGAVLLVSLATVTTVAGLQPPQWSPQPETGFRTFAVPDPTTVPTEVVEAATSAPSPTPTVRTTLPPDLKGAGQVAQAAIPVPTPTPRPTPPPAPPAPVAPPAAPPAPPVSSVPSVADAQNYALSQIGSTQYGCLYQIFQHESGWNPRASNPSSGAYGIPQALPGSKMASAGGDWAYNPVTQVKWGLGYVSGSYGSACNAWAFWQAHGWY